MKIKRVLSAILATVILMTTLLAGSITSAAADVKATHVTNGLVSSYKGAGNSGNATVWTDSVGKNNMTITKNAKNYLTTSGLLVEGTKHYFPQAIVDLVNGNAFTVEISLGDFVSIGGSFNTFMNSDNDNFALFRRNSNDHLEFKWAGEPDSRRPMVGNGLELIKNSVISITYEVGGYVMLYVDGTLAAKVSCNKAMGADKLFIGQTGTKDYRTTYRSIRFYNRVLTPEEVANNARADGATVTTPAKNFINVAQPITNISGDISMIREIGSKAEMDAMISAKALPATAIYTINSSLKALDADGKSFATVDEIFTAHDYKIIPAFRVNNLATANALVTYLKGAGFYDCLVVSDNPALVKDFREALPQVTGVIDYTETYKSVNDLSEEQCLDIRRSIKTNNGTVALLPVSLCRNEDVQYLYNRQVNVWAKTTDNPAEGEQYTALLSGAIGVVSDATDSLLNIACNKLPKNTMTRVTLNIAHRGLPSKAPENTIEGSLLAYEQGANVIEFDVYLTTDNEAVVMHDATTGSTCNSNLTVENSTLAELKKLYVNKGFESNSTYKNCRIPTLKEYLKTFKGKDCQLFIEIKSEKTAIVKVVKECIEEYGMYDQCSIVTFKGAIMSAMRTEYPEMSVGAFSSSYMGGLNPEEDLRSAMSFIGKYNATLNPSYEELEANDIRAALQRGISIYPYTFKGDINTYKNHLMWGYSGLTGNNADVFNGVARSISYTPTSLIVDPGSSLTPKLKVTYYNHEVKTTNPTAITIVSGQDFVTKDGNTLTFKGRGEVTFIMSYNVKIGNETITLYTQPVTLATYIAPPAAPDESDEPVDTDPTPVPPSETDDLVPPSETDDPVPPVNGEDNDSTTYKDQIVFVLILVGVSVPLVTGVVIFVWKKKH